MPVIGGTTMKVNGVDVTMDVAPHLKNGRTCVLARKSAGRGLVWARI